MHIKMSKVFIKNLTLKEFSEIKNLEKSDLFEFGFSSNIKLTVPIIFKGKETNIAVNSKLIASENKRGIGITILCNFTKFILFSLTIGILSSLVILAMFYNITFFIFSSVFVSILIFLMYYFKTKKIATKYVNKIKTDLLK